MSNNMSARFGEKTNTLEDFYVVRWFLRGLSRYTPAVAKLDPHLGIVFAPKPPPGYVFESKARAITISIWCLIAFIVLITSCRFILRIFVKQLRSGWDDWVMVLAAILQISNLIIFLRVTALGGLGGHLWDITYADYAAINPLSISANVTMFAGIGLVKISMVIWLRRVIGTSSRVWANIINALLVLLVLYTVLSVITPNLMSIPTRYLYDPVWAGAQESGYTIPYNTTTLSFAFSGMSAVFDFIILLIPAFIFIPMKLDFWKKVRMSLLFSTGIITTVCATYRIIASVHVQVTGSKTFPDFPWISIEGYKWTAVEVGCTFLVANMPTINTLGCKFVEKVRTQNSSSEKDSERGIGSSEDDISEQAETQFEKKKLNHQDGKEQRRNRMSLQSGMSR